MEIFKFRFNTFKCPAKKGCQTVSDCTLDCSSKPEKKTIKKEKNQSQNGYILPSKFNDE